MPPKRAAPKRTFFEASKLLGYLKPGKAFKKLPKKGTRGYRAIVQKMK